MRLFVCYGTFGPIDRHACGRAHAALLDAGHEPEVVRPYGCFRTDRLWPGRREVRRLSGSLQVPTLVLDDGTVVDESQNIVAWARANPA